MYVNPNYPKSIEIHPCMVLLDFGGFSIPQYSPARVATCTKSMKLHWLHLLDSEL